MCKCQSDLTICTAADGSLSSDLTKEADTQGRYWIFPPVGHCINEGKTMLGGGIANSITDLWTTILPIPIVMRLQMPLRQRIWVCILLSMGVIVTIAGSVRTYYTWKRFVVNLPTCCSNTNDEFGV